MNDLIHASRRSFLKLVGMPLAATTAAKADIIYAITDEPIPVIQPAITAATEETKPNPLQSELRKMMGQVAVCSKGVWTVIGDLVCIDTWNSDQPISCTLMGSINPIQWRGRADARVSAQIHMLSDLPQLKSMQDGAIGRFNAYGSDPADLLRISLQQGQQLFALHTPAYNIQHAQWTAQLDSDEGIYVANVTIHTIGEYQLVES